MVHWVRKEFYNEFSNTEFEYFGYSPVRSLKEEDFKEYGLLLTQYGIFEKMQIKDQDRCNVQFFPIFKFMESRGRW